MAEGNMQSTFDARIKHPFCMIVTGPSMSGKTHFVVNLIQNSQLIHPPPNNIVWFYGIDTYDTRSNLRGDHIRFVRGIPESFDEYLDSDKLINTLFIFDDLMQESVNNKTLSNLFTRQSHHMNVSVILMLQDVFYTGTERKTFFRNAQYLVLFSSPLDRSGIYAIAHKIMPKRIRGFLNLFEMICERPYGYLFIDGRQSTPSDARLRTDIFKPYQRVFMVQ